MTASTPATPDPRIESIHMALSHIEASEDRSVSDARELRLSARAALASLAADLAHAEQRHVERMAPVIEAAADANDRARKAEDELAATRQALQREKVCFREAVKELDEARAVLAGEDTPDPRTAKVAALGLRATPKADEPSQTANGPSGASPEGNDGDPGAAA